MAKELIGTAPDACEAAAQYIERWADRRPAAGTRSVA
jgi:rhamnosyltransferase subunit B